jgi:hypothetical protein
MHQTWVKLFFFIRGDHDEQARLPDFCTTNIITFADDRGYRRGGNRIGLYSWPILEQERQ